ncbi:hypothetical protein [Edwardsiella ictaluri]|uniref:hypothetical protein n=1 Tax=Edwardsiella ictaluri TaxID=67780 RepID=UPI0039F6F69B
MAAKHRNTPHSRQLTSDAPSITSRLHRIHTLALYLQVELSHRKDTLPFMCVPAVLSYIADDITAIQRDIAANPEQPM